MTTSDITESEMAWLRKNTISEYIVSAREFVKLQGEFITYSTMLSRMKIIDDQLAGIPDITLKASRGLEKVMKDTHDDLVWKANRLIAKADAMLELGLPVDEALIAMAADIITNA